MPERERSGRPASSRRRPLRASEGSSTLWTMDVGLSLLLGAAHSLAMSFPQLWWLQLLCVAGLAWRVSRASVRRSAALGWVFGTAWLTAGTWWLYISMHQYGGLSAGLAALAVLALSGFLSLYLAIAMALFAMLRRHRPPLDVLLFAGCWLLAELARGVLFTGFPWAASGYAHVDSPLAWLAPWVGVYGIGFVSALLGAAMVVGMRSTAGLVTGAVIGIGIVATTMVVLAALKPVQFTQPTGTLNLSLLQSNVPQDQKFAAETLPQTLGWARDKLLAARGDLVVGPETIVPLLPEQLPEGYWDALQKHFQRGSQAALIGRPLGSFEVGYTNSAVGVSRDTVKRAEGFYRYDKHHLVPFGEFIPPGFRWFTDLMNIPLGDFNRGAKVPPSFPVKGEWVAPNICYEDLFGEELAARFADVDAPTVFVNISNIGWFGDTIAVQQHLLISRMRTLEFQVPMVRATNTGATAVIDHTAKVTASLPPFTQGVLETSVQGRRGLTPYAKWASRFDLWPLLALSLLLLGVALPLRRRED